MVEDDWGEYYDFVEYPYSEGRRPIDGMMLAGLGILVLFAFHVIRSVIAPSISDPFTARTASRQQEQTTVPAAPVAPPEVQVAPLTPGQIEWHQAITAPYTSYVLTQGPHGMSYGHYAIDIAAGKGEPILSPINGSVTQRYTDEWNNPIIVIENEIYQVTMYHGDYLLNVGDPVQIGQQVGLESNHGYTMDMQGRLCAGRDCGYHTHLNIFDKRLGTNINPLDVIGY